MELKDGGGDRRVVLTGIDMPFGQLVVALIKIALAAVPAVIVLLLLIELAAMVLGVVLGFGGRPWRHW